MHALLHGHFAEAWMQNPFAVILLPGILVLLLMKYKKVRFWGSVLLVLVGVVFSILRN